jgi:ABC-type cobalt transport system substrate-binding protein
MKKKIVIESLVIIIVILVIITAVVWKKRGNSSDNNDGNIVDLTVEDQFKFYPENDYNYPSGEYLEWNVEEKNEFTIEATVETGTIIFKVYDMNGEDAGQLEKYTLCEENIIDSTGVYTFEPENLENGKMYFFTLEPEDYGLEKEDRYVVASGTFRRTRYK